VFRWQGPTSLHYDEAALGASFFEAWDIEINAAGAVFMASFDVYEFADGEWTNLTENTDIHAYLGADLYFSQSGDLYLAGDLVVIARFDGAQWDTYAHGLDCGSRCPNHCL